MSIGKKIKKYRLGKGVTQSELAESIGSYQKNISSYESEDVIPSAEVIQKIAKALDVSPDYLLSEKRQNIADPKILKVCNELDKLDEADKSAILTVIQAFLRDVKSRKQY